MRQCATCSKRGSMHAHFSKFSECFRLGRAMLREEPAKYHNPHSINRGTTHFAAETQQKQDDANLHFPNLFSSNIQENGSTSALGTGRKGGEVIQEVAQESMACLQLPQMNQHLSMDTLRIPEERLRAAPNVPLGNPRIKRDFETQEQVKGEDERALSIRFKDILSHGLKKNLSTSPSTPKTSPTQEGFLGSLKRKKRVKQATEALDTISVNTGVRIVGLGVPDITLQKHTTIAPIVTRVGDLSRHLSPNNNSKLDISCLKPTFQFRKFKHGNRYGAEGNISQDARLSSRPRLQEAHPCRGSFSEFSVLSLKAGTDAVAPRKHRALRRRHPGRSLQRHTRQKSSEDCLSSLYPTSQTSPESFVCKKRNRVSTIRKFPKGAASKIRKFRKLNGNSEQDTLRHVETVRSKSSKQRRMGKNTRHAAGTEYVQNKIHEKKAKTLRVRRSELELLRRRRRQGRNKNLQMSNATPPGLCRNRDAAKVSSCSLKKSGKAPYDDTKINYDGYSTRVRPANVMQGTSWRGKSKNIRGFEMLNSMLPPDSFNVFAVPYPIHKSVALDKQGLPAYRDQSKRSRLPVSSTNFMSIPHVRNAQQIFSHVGLQNKSPFNPLDTNKSPLPGLIKSVHVLAFPASYAKAPSKNNQCIMRFDGQLGIPTNFPVHAESFTSPISKRSNKSNGLAHKDKARLMGPDNENGGLAKMNGQLLPSNPRVTMASKKENWESKQIDNIQMQGEYENLSPRTLDKVSTTRRKFLKNFPKGKPPEKHDTRDVWFWRDLSSSH